MLDLFTIFSKSGIVLWCFNRTNRLFSPHINALLRNVILEEKVGTNIFPHQDIYLKFKLDNEFELVFVVAYQNFVQQAYVDKFLDDISLEFRDKYKQELEGCNFFYNYEFSENFQKVLHVAEEYGKELENKPRVMRTFQESQKSKKTVASLTETKVETKVTAAAPITNKKKKGNKAKNEVVEAEPLEPAEPASPVDVILQNRQNFEKKMKGKKEKPNGLCRNKVPTSPKDKSKKPRVWENSGGKKNLQTLDYSKSEGTDSQMSSPIQYQHHITSMEEIPEMEYSSESSEESEDEEVVNKNKDASQQKSSGGGMFGVFRSLVGSKTISEKDMEPVLAKLKDHMIMKNVAADIAEKLCHSISAKLEGRVLGTFSGVSSLVKNTLNDALLQILSPKKRMDILRDVLNAKEHGRPYAIVFCGVNGVGKSTNLAKIAFWLTSNKLRVLIAACDTFRAGAVEQLRSHRNNLNNHNQGEYCRTVELFEKGYGKDPAGIAMEAINYARDSKFDVVLIDTAGRMQDNEPLMRALAKLIKVNQPDLVLFVGEALVGNEAVDQLTKFNQALADFSSKDNPHLIDGIVLTKFDTIDDKVGAAISMTYITGQPIIFIGTGQTYSDLKKLEPRLVVRALMK